MARRTRKSRSTAFAFDAITVEGALIAPAMLAQIAALKVPTDQKPADYGVPKGLEIRDEIARYFRIGQALFKEFTAAKEPSQRATTDFILGLLRDVFGFSDITSTEPKLLADRLYPITLEALDGRVPVVVVSPTDPLERSSEILSRDGRRRSAASCLQDWLNVEDAALWGLTANGDRIRLMRDNASLTRPAYIEADLRHIFGDEAFSDFTTLWLLIHATRFGKPGAPAADCTLERWRDAGAKEGEVARDRLRDGVENALLALGNGFVSHPDNTALRKNLTEGSQTTLDFFGQLLRLVYRLIFLFAAEDRDLLYLPNASVDARQLYSEGYSVGRLRERAIKRRYHDLYHDQWEGLLIVFKALETGEAILGLPALDGLFARDTLAALEDARLSNRDLMQAIYSLAWLRGDGAPLPVNWRDMQTEELGSVYESLLELTPQLFDEARRFAFAEGLESKGNARKTSGSYYTPDSLVQTLLDSALDPVLDRVTAESNDPERALLSITVIDPACGSGHFLLAAARRIATRLAKLRAGGLASAEDFRHALRDVVRACIYGVDRNPMAVELAKVALWIETVDPGKPLGFLDANVRCGDALFGIFDLKALEKGIPDAAYKALAGDDKETAKYYAKRNKDELGGQGRLDLTGGASKLPPSKPLADAARAIRAMPENSTEEIAVKRKQFEAGAVDPKNSNIRIACDLYIAAFLTPKAGGEPTNRLATTIPTTAQVWEALAGRNVYGPLVGKAQELSRAARAFNWPLEFPDVMASGGFDAVLGNPPWEVVELGEEEYFSQRFPEIAELKGVARKRAIAALENSHPGIFKQYKLDKRQFEVSNEFSRASDRFKLTARGKVNTYSLFAELFATLVTPAGRAGVILPLGIATNETTATFFSDLMNRRRLVALLSMAEIKQWFAGTKDNQSFCLLTVGSSQNAEFAFRIETPSDLADPNRRFVLSIDQISRMNPNTKTAPVFRTRRDAELTTKIYERVPVLVELAKGRSGNPWELEFRQGLFNMTSDSHSFRTASQLRELDLVRSGLNWDFTPHSKREDRKSVPRSLDDDCYLPLFESKMFSFFDSRYGFYPDGFVDDTRALPRPTLQQQGDPNWVALPRFWVPKALVVEQLAAINQSPEWLFVFRKLTNTTNERTLISSVIPVAGVGDSAYVVFSKKKPVETAALIGAFASVVLDYVVRQKMGGTNLNLFYLYQLPIPSPSAFSENDNAFVVRRIVELTYTSHSMASFARDLGHDGPPFKWDEERRALLRAELDAWYARVYGLTRDELRYILDPADVMGSDYPSETFRVLKKNEISKYGEYRTRRLVLEAWDRLERGELM